MLSRIRQAENSLGAICCGDLVLRVAFVGLFAFGIFPFAHAADYTWSGSGNWTTDGANWLGTPTLPWSGTNGPSNVAVFNTGASPTVTVGETVTTNGITFTQGATLSGGTISLAGTTPTLTVGANSTISSVIAGSSLTKNGTGLLTLSGTNTYTGGTIVNAGTIGVSANLNLGAAGTPLTMGGTSTLALGANSITYDHPIAVQGSNVTIAGAGANTFSGQLTGTGNLTVNPLAANGHNFTNANNTFSGQLAIATAGVSLTVRFNSLGDSSTNAIVLGSAVGGPAGGTFLYQGTSQLTLNRPIQLQGGGNTSTASTNRNYINNQGGGLVLNGNMSVSSGATARSVVLQNDSTTAPSTFGGIISNGLAALGVEKAGVGTWILSGANTYTGTTTVTGGWLQLGSAENAGTSGPMGKPATLANSVVLNGGGLRFTSNNTYDYTTSGRLQLADGATGSIDTNGQNVTFVNAIGVGAAKTGRLTKTGAGTLTLQGVNTYTGTTSVSGGTLTIDAGAGGALSSSSPLTLSGTGVFNYDNTTASGAKSQTLAAFNFSSGDGTVSVTRTAAQAVTLSGSSFTRGAGATGNFVYGGTQGTIGTDSSINLTGAAAGFLSQGLFYQGSDYAWLNGAGTFVRGINYGTDASSQSVTASTTALSGTTLYAKVSGAGQVTGQTTGTITTLNIANANDFTLAAGQTLTLNGILKSGNAAGGRITGGSGIQTGSNAEIVIRTDGAADTLNINTPILANGTNAITKAGPGLLVLSATNTFTGPITINSGTVQVGSTGRLGAGTFVGGVSIASGAVFDYSGDQNQVFNTAGISGSGAMFVNTLGQVSFNVNSSFLGGLYVKSGTAVSANGLTSALGAATVYLGDTAGSRSAELSHPANSSVPTNNIVVQPGSSGTKSIRSTAMTTAAWAGNITLNDTVALLATNAGGTATFSGTISGGSGISLAGNVSTIRLTGSNTFSGTTSVSAGRLLLANQLAAQNSTLNITSGTVIYSSAVAANAFTVGGLAGTGTVTLANNAGTPAAIVLSVGNNNADTTFSGRLIGAGSLTKIGTGVLTLSGSNTYAGPTSVSAGALAVNGWLGSAVTVDSGAMLGGSGVIDAALSGSGLVSPGNSPGILTATQFDPSSGLDAAFEFTGLAPTYTSPTASVNDILRLTNGADPFASAAFTAGNVLDIYFNVDSITGGDVFEGGFFTGLTAEGLLTSLNGLATFNYWAKTNGAGERTFNGVNYVTLTGVTLQTSYGTKDFGGSVGNVTGSVTQFVIAVPEPAAVALAGIGVGVAGWAAARRRCRRTHG